MSHQIDLNDVQYLPHISRGRFVCETRPMEAYPPAQLIEQVARTFTGKLSPAEASRFNGRLERGLQLALENAVTPAIGAAYCYQVCSATGIGSYLVDLEHKTCQCPDSQKGNICKHRIAAYYYCQAVKLQKEQDMQSASTQLPKAEVKSSTSPDTNPREAQILKEVGFDPHARSAKDNPPPVHRLGSLYSRYLHGADLDGKPYRVTIQEITLERVMPHLSQPVKEKWCLWVSGLPDGLPTGILFGVRGEKDLLVIFGRVELSALKGRQMTIYPVTTSVAGQNTVSIRFRSAS